MSGVFTAAEREAIKAEFPLVRARAYLNYASVGPLPRRARQKIDAINDTFQRLDRNFDPDTDLAAAQSRAASARLVGGDEPGVGLFPNTSFGLVWALAHFDLKPGEAVLISDQEFPALRYACWHLRNFGVKTVTVTVPPYGGITPDLLESQLTTHPEIRVVGVSWVSFRSGYLTDLASLARVAHKHGARLLVDGIQGVGARPFDALAWDVDVVCVGTQKWLCCPVGMGFVWCRKELRDLRPSPWGGWMSVDWNAVYTELLGPPRDMNSGPRTAEVGTANFQGVRAMAECTGWIAELGVERIARHADILFDLLHEGLDPDRFEWLSDRHPAHRSSIVFLRPRQGDADALRKHLSRQGVTTGVREGAVRVSPHFPTDRSEIEHLVHSLHEFA